MEQSIWVARYIRRLSEIPESDGLWTNGRLDKWMSQSGMERLIEQDVETPKRAAEAVVNKELEVARLNES